MKHKNLQKVISVVFAADTGIGSASISICCISNKPSCVGHSKRYNLHCAG